FCGMKLLENKNQLLMPVGINFHGLEMFQKAPTLKYKIQQVFLKKPVLKSMQNADVVFSLGGKLTEIIAKHGISKEKIVQIPIGIDESWLNTMALKIHSPRKFIFIGRYERRKGIEELTKTIKQLLPKHRFSIDFIGAIPEYKKIKSSAVFYYGSITEVKKIKQLLSQADVLICPSFSEGMPTVILEAMASGLAVIATDVGAVSEQVTEKNGKLITPVNINELKQAIIEFINMPEDELLKMKQYSMERISDNFTWDKIIIKTIESIKQLN
ncbi:MAG TPA: glycosyltransferase family 4 protein, partial [Bacteroidia bacterium]|nr:glycosyltransferase family 4 protein [Bacteroidia bacterium]